MREKERENVEGLGGMVLVSDDISIQKTPQIPVDRTKISRNLAKLLDF